MCSCGDVDVIRMEVGFDRVEPSNGGDWAVGIVWRRLPGHIQPLIVFCYLELYVSTLHREECLAPEEHRSWTGRDSKIGEGTDKVYFLVEYLQPVGSTVGDDSPSPIIELDDSFVDAESRPDHAWPQQIWFNGSSIGTVGSPCLAWSRLRARFLSLVSRLWDHNIILVYPLKYNSFGVMPQQHAKTSFRSLHR